MNFRAFHCPAGTRTRLLRSDPEEFPCFKAAYLTLPGLLPDPLPAEIPAYQGGSLPDRELNPAPANELAPKGLRAPLR
jgi:hypothetical protein